MPTKECAMSYSEWKTRSKVNLDLVDRIDVPVKAAVERALEAAYKAGERQGRKDVESLVLKAAKLRDMIESGQCRG
jgi:hypothetical protein